MYTVNFRYLNETKNCVPCGHKRTHYEFWYRFGGYLPTCFDCHNKVLAFIQDGGMSFGEQIATVRRKVSVFAPEAQRSCR